MTKPTNPERRRVMTLVGTRPELIKMSRVIAELDRQVDHVLVHSGQNQADSLSQVFFDQLAIRPPDYYLGVAGDSPAQVIADVIQRTDALLAQEAPEALLLYGDTNTCMAVIAAKRRKIPVFHMEAGNRCFDQRVPEELNRKVVDHLSDINLVLTEQARRHLLAEGLRPESIIKTGSHMEEVLAYYRPWIERSEILDELSLAPGRYFLVSAHREENVDTPANLTSLQAVLQDLAERYQYPVIVSTHPRTAKRLEAAQGRVAHPLVRFVEPFGLLDYIRLQQSATCVLSDSGTLMEEAALLNVPAVMLRQSHERPEGMDAGTLIVSGLQPPRVMDAVRVILAQQTADSDTADVPDYRGGAVSQQVVRVVLSSIDWVNRAVWQRHGS